MGFRGADVQSHGWCGFVQALRRLVFSAQPMVRSVRFALQTRNTGWLQFVDENDEIDDDDMG
jgi:hypothetical protein